MKELAFSKKITQWIMVCVTTVNYSIVVNGNPSQTFESAKGIRQGYPISPFLFDIAMKYLSRSLNGLKHDKSYKFHTRCSKLGIRHLSLLMIY